MVRDRSRPWALWLGVVLTPKNPFPHWAALEPWAVCPSPHFSLDIGNCIGPTQNLSHPLSSLTLPFSKKWSIFQIVTRANNQSWSHALTLYLLLTHSHPSILRASVTPVISHLISAWLCGLWSCTYSPWSCFQQSHHHHDLFHDSQVYSTHSHAWPPTASLDSGCWPHSS